MSESLSSSISSEDQFNIVPEKTSGEDVEVSLASSSSRDQAPFHSTPDKMTAAAKTPLMKTPTMDALTRKYEFLLKNDKGDEQQQHTVETIEGTNNDDPTPYFHTPPPSGPKINKLSERTRSYGSLSRSHNSSRNSSRSNSPAPYITSSAQKIMQRLQSMEDSSTTIASLVVGEDQQKHFSSSPSSWDVLDHPPSHQQRHPPRYRSNLKQNLEQRLKMLDEQTSNFEYPPQHYHHDNATTISRKSFTGGGTPDRVPAQQQISRKTSPFHKASMTPPRDEPYMIPKKSHKKQQKKQQHLEPPMSPSDNPRSTTTSTTMALSETTKSELPNVPANKMKANIIPDKEVREEVQPQHQQKGIYALPNNPSASSATTTTTTDDTGVNNNSNNDETSAINSKYEEDTASFWHRWKMAEKRMQQQQEQFEQEKVEWVRQLESAYNANAQVEALAKRMEVQLLAVHKTCLQQDGDDELDDEEEGLLSSHHYDPKDNSNKNINSNKEPPIDPLHLLMLRESGTLPQHTLDSIEQLGSDEGDQNNDNGDSNNDNGMDSFEYTDRLERKMARTKTKNIILSHLVKLLERQAEEQKHQLEGQLKLEKEERQELWQEFRQLELRLEKEQQQKGEPDCDKAYNRVDSPTPDQRDQQYEQERNQLEAEVKALRENVNRYKQIADGQQQREPATLSNIVPNTETEEAQLKQKSSPVDDQILDLHNKLQAVVEEKQEVEKQHESLQVSFEKLQKQVADAEHAQKTSEEQNRQEILALQKQIDNSKNETLQLQEKLKRAGPVAAVGSVTSNMIERMERQREKERTKWESQLEAAQAEAAKCKASESELRSELEEIRQQLESGTGSISLSEMQDVEEKHEQEVHELGEQLNLLQSDCDAKLKEISDLQTKLDESNAEVNRLNKAADDDQGFIKQLEEEITHLEFSLQVERQNLEGAEAEMLRLEGMIAELKAQKMDTTMEKSSGKGAGAMAEKYEHLCKQLEDASNELKQCQSSLDDESAKYKESMEKNASLKLEMQDLKRQHNKEKGEWERTVLSLRVEKDTGDGVASQNKLLSKQIQELESELKNTKSVLSAAQESLMAEDSNSEERNSRLSKELEQLNERFVVEMKEMEARYKSWLSEKDYSQGELKRTISSLENQIEQLQNELQSARTEAEENQREIVEERDDLAQQLQQLKKELESSTSARDELENRNCALNRELEQLNERFVGEMKELENHYQVLKSERNGTEDELQQKIGLLQNQIEKLQVEAGNQNEEERGAHLKERETSSLQLAELAKKNGVLEERVAVLQNELEASKSALESTTQISRKLERQIEEQKEDFAKEKDEWESQVRQLATCESNDSVRTQELIEQKAERERQLDEAKKELQAGLKALRSESEKYRIVVEKNMSLDLENKQLKLEKDHWESHMQALRDETKKQQEMLASKNATLMEEVIELKEMHEKVLKDWRLASEQSNREMDGIQKRLDETALEKNSLQSELAATERRIETLQKNHKISKEEWKEQADLNNQRINDFFTLAVDELKREVLKMGEQLVVSNQSIQELTAKRQEEADILANLDRIQHGMEDTASKVAADHDVMLGRLVEIEKAVTASSGQNGGVPLDQHNSLLEQILEISLRCETAMRNFGEVDVATVRTAIRKEMQVEFDKLQSDLMATEGQLREVTCELEAEKYLREIAEKNNSKLQKKLSWSSEESIHPPALLNNSKGGGQLVEACEGSLIDCLDLDRQFADADALIENEMDQIRNIGHQEQSRAIVVKTNIVEDSDELTGARQAMLAQTLLLVQSLRDLMVNGANDEEEEIEEQSGAVLQHLEILSELIGEVDLMEASAVVPASSSQETIEVHGDEVESVLVQAKSTTPVVSDKRRETELLRFELAQDDSMLDLLHDECADQKMACPDVSMVAPATDCSRNANESTTERATSPIELVVEQTYSRCQVLERERCDLINVTLDLLSASREANKAEIDAAIAGARRKASEEMIAMKRETRAQVDQIWGRLCEKCRHGLLQG